MLALSLLTAVGLALTTVAMTETAIAAAYGEASQSFYAAESAVDHALHALALEADWQAVVAGDAVASPRNPEVLEVLRGEDVPPGTLYAYGWFAQLLPDDWRGPPLATLAWVAADADVEGRLVVTGRAYGGNGSRRTIEVRVEPAEGRPRIVSWREVR